MLLIFKIKIDEYLLMKKFIFICMGMILPILGANAQKTYTGKIIDRDNNPVFGATIVAVNNANKGTTTNERGLFKISLNAPQVQISMVGFNQKKVTLSTAFNTIVLLENSLDEIIISASREQQKRNEIPAAISVINAEKIAQTKAFGIDQLVNDTPGVYVSSSRGSSNEQHFTAVRSPISTKPLFLFLEDGLPLRPTAIFNHNALLELNNISYKKVEVLRGPNASIYGSDAIGGSFNFITKDPTEEISGHVSLQANDLGFSSVGFDFGNQVTDKFGIYIASQFNQRNNGPFEHSDYDKYALKVKTVFTPNTSSKLTVTYAGSDFVTDMAGSVGETNYQSKNFESNQTFTNRDAVSHRISAAWDEKWNENNKTSFSALYRDNVMKQNPSFRIRQNRTNGALNGTGSGEVNNNTFYSYVGNIQHQLKIPNLNSKLILGTSIDVTSQDYIANRTNITVNTTTRKNIAFEVLPENFILNYEADINNYAAYAQLEISPIEQIKITGGLRYDYFNYDFRNRIDAQNALADSNDTWNNLAPKIGININTDENTGFYANFSTGFTPPQSSTLYRSRDENRGIKPSRYENFEIGTYTKAVKNLKLDVALYHLKGKNTLITIRDPETDDDFINTNAGQTTSYGIEYGVSYKPTSNIKLSHNGSYAKHVYNFFEFGGTDFSNTDRETAPNLVGTSKIILTPTKNLNLSLEHELIGKYATSLEGQARDANDNPITTNYTGHNIFNFLTSYTYRNAEIWVHALNIFDKLYANRVSYNRFRNENSFTVGNPRAFHVGLKYNF